MDSNDQMAKACRMIVEMAEHKHGRYCWIHFKIDPLQAITKTLIHNARFSDRGRRFSAIVDAQGMRASEVLNVSQPTTRASQVGGREASN